MSKSKVRLIKRIVITVFLVAVIFSAVVITRLSSADKKDWVQTIEIEIGRNRNLPGV